MCDHGRVYEDLEVADAVCMDCGLVLDRVVGRCRADRSQVGRLGGEGGGDDEGDRRARQLEIKRGEIRSVLDVLGLDTECNVEGALNLFDAVYECRSSRSGFRRTEKRARVATAFAICQTLTQSGYPRSHTDVAGLCGLEGDGALMDIPKQLCLSAEEMERLTQRGMSYELGRVRPGDLIDPLCAHLGIPFAVASRMRLRADEAEWTLYGHPPKMIAAAVGHLELSKTDPSRARQFCEMLTCRPAGVRRVAEKLHI